MVKERQAHIRYDLIGNDGGGMYYGDDDKAVAECYERITGELLVEYPRIRRRLKRAMRRALYRTLPEWVHYLLDDWAVSVCGAAALALGIYALSWVCQWIGVV